MAESGESYLPKSVSAYEVKDHCEKVVSAFQTNGGRLHMPPVSILRPNSYAEQSWLVLQTLSEIEKHLEESLPGDTDILSDRDQAISVNDLACESDTWLFVGKNNLLLHKNPVERYFLGVLCNFDVESKPTSADLVSYTLPPVDDYTAHLSANSRGSVTIEKVYLPKKISLDPEAEAISTSKLDRRKKAKPILGAVALGATATMSVVLVRLINKRRRK